MSTEAQLKALSNSELASGTQIPALKHRTVNDAIIEEMYDAQSRGNVLSGVQSATSLASGDEVFVIRSGEAYLLDADELGFVSTLADLTDVNIPSPSNDQVLAYNFGTSKWVSKDVSTLSSVVSITGTATTNQMVKFTGLSSIGNSNISDDGSIVAITGNLSVNTDGLYVNSSNNRVGVGTSTPATSFQVVGNILADFVATSGNSFTKIFSMDQDIQTTDAVEFAAVTAGSFVTSGGASTDFVKGDGSLDGTTYQDEAEKNQANGYAPLDSGAKIPLANLPDSILGQVSYQGTWAASSNTPTLANPPASTTKGEYYVASDDGTQFGIDFKTGDWIISNGTAWEKVDNTDAVTSVFGRLGNIVANESDYSSFYVDFDSDQSITGQKTFGSGDLRIVSGGSGNLPTIFINSSVGSSTESGFNSLGFNGSNDFYFTKGVGASFNGAIFSYDNAAIRTYTLQDASGTLALTSDLNTLNASNITTGTLADARLSSNVALKDINNNFSVGQTINGNLAVDTNTLFVDSANNRVGIGTSSPSQRLDVNGNIKLLSDGFTPAQIPQASIGLANDGYVYLRGGSGGLIIGDTDNTTAFVARETEIAQIFTNDTERMRIASSGNVGIGESDPDHKLHVVSNEQCPALFESTIAGGGIALMDSTTTNDEQVGIGAFGDNLCFRAGGDADGNMRLHSTGNLTIGGNLSDSGNRLDVRGDAVVSGDLGVGGSPLASGISGSYQSISVIDSNVASVILEQTAAKRFEIASVASNGGELWFRSSDDNVNAIIIDNSNNTRINSDLAVDTDTLFVDASSNRVGVGTDSPSDKLTVEGTDAKIKVNNTTSSNTDLVVLDLTGTVTGSSNGNERAILLGKSGNAERQAKIAYSQGSSNGQFPALSFFTGDNTDSLDERMRIDSAGNVLVSNGNQTDGTLIAGRNGNNNSILALSDANNTSEAYLRGYSTSISSSTVIIYSNGNIVNSNNSYGAISDIKMKENIEDATPKLDDLMRVKVRNYNLIGDDKKQIGVIAQELEEVFPAMIDESQDFEEVEVPQLDEEGNEVLNDDGEVVTTKERVSKGTATKSVKYSVFVPMLIKAMQEQQSQIKEQQSIINDLIKRIENLEK